MENGVTKVMMEPWKQVSGRVTPYPEPEPESSLARSRLGGNVGDLPEPRLFGASVRIAGALGCDRQRSRSSAR